MPVCTLDEAEARARSTSKCVMMRDGLHNNNDFCSATNERTFTCLVMKSCNEQSLRTNILCAVYSIARRILYHDFSDI